MFIRLSMTLLEAVPGIKNGDLGVVWSVKKSEA